MWPEEKKLGHHIIRINEFCLAWEETEKGSFKLTFYPAVMMPTIEHTPWNEKNLPIPPGILRGSACQRRTVKFGLSTTYSH